MRMEISQLHTYRAMQTRTAATIPEVVPAKPQAAMGLSSLQIDHQHRNICRADSGDAAGLAQGDGADVLEFLPGLQAKTLDGRVVHVRGQQPGFLLPELRNLLFLPG